MGFLVCSKPSAEAALVPVHRAGNYSGIPNGTLPRCPKHRHDTAAGTEVEHSRNRGSEGARERGHKQGPEN